MSVLRDFFDCRVLSYEVQSMKPEPKIYQAAADASNRDPADLWFTDDLDRNVERANACGWRAHPFVGVRQLRSDLHGIGVLSNF